MDLANFWNGPSGYQIERSLRFNSADSANLNRSVTPGTNAKIGTFSFWCKRSKLGSGSQTILQQDANTIYLGFDNNGSGADTFGVFLGGNSPAQARVTTQVFRDPSSWYHFIVAVDTTHGTASERLKVYVNGTQITAFSTSNTVSQNVDVFASGSYRIGSYAGSIEFFSGYLTEIHFIDGQALTPSSFGETDTITGVWKPKKYAGTYGTNGFYLKFADNSGTTSTTLGKDSSGNGNNWTPNNFSVTAGAGNDSLIDTPTPYADGGNGRGNYCTWNPLSIVSPSTLSNGNLDVSTGAAGGGYTYGTFAIPTSGKWYWEIKPTSNVGSSFCRIGLGNITLSKLVTYYNNGNKSIDGADTAYGASYTDNDIIGVAYNSDSGTITFYKNNSTQGNISYSLGSETLFPMIHDGSGSAGITAEANFGQRSFSYTPPSGFLALNTNSLPEPSIKKPSSYMDVVTYTGNGTSQTISSLNFSPDLVWAKRRSGAASHGLVDSVRGTGKTLFSNLTDQEDTGDSNLTAFNSNGFTAGSGGNFNANGFTYVAWCWDESATPGFDIVTYTGNGGTQNISHNLGVSPSFIVVKNRSAVTNWISWHSTFAATDYIALNLANAKNYAGSLSTLFTGVSSTTFSVGSDSSVNGSGSSHVAYCFSEVAGFSKFGSYTGNGSTDGPFIYTGFRVGFYLLKKTTTGVANGNWYILDATRNTYNPTVNYMLPNSAAAEGVTTAQVDLLSNGIKMRDAISDYNESGQTYIYAAFAVNPFKYSLAR